MWKSMESGHPMILLWMSAQAHVLACCARCPSPVLPNCPLSSPIMHKC